MANQTARVLGHLKNITLFEYCSVNLCLYLESSHSLVARMRNACMTRRSQKRINDDGKMGIRAHSLLSCDVAFMFPRKQTSESCAGNNNIS